MTPIVLPALDGSLPLGWLAALGLLRLACLREPEAALSWDQDRGCAVLHSNMVADTDGVAAMLTTVREQLQPGQFWPDAPVGFPPPGEAPDRLVVKREDFSGLLQYHQEARDVLACLVTDLAVNTSGVARRTPMVAPTGKQSFFTMVRNQHEAVAEPERMAEALTAWVRLPGAGESFDAAAVNSAADAADGRPGERPVPGATWLAVQALPMLRLSGDGKSTKAAAWRRVDRQPTMLWPLWSPPLSVRSVCTLIEHPALQAHAAGRDLVVDASLLMTLGVWRVCAARRRATGNADGPLVPVQVRSRGAKPEQRLKSSVRGPGRARVHDRADRQRGERG